MLVPAAVLIIWTGIFSNVFQNSLFFKLFKIFKYIYSKIKDITTIIAFLLYLFQSSEKYQKDTRGLGREGWIGEKI